MLVKNKKWAFGARRGGPLHSKVQGGVVGRQVIDVWCTSCDRKITLEEVASDYHLEHLFEPMEWAAIQAVSMYVRGAMFLRPN